MTEYFELPINMDRICRICLTESASLSPIFCAGQEVVVNDYSSLSQKIQVCGSIEIDEQDGLPSLICDVCVYKATVAHEFRQQCQHSDAKLRMYFNKPVKTAIVDTCTQTESKLAEKKQQQIVQEEEEEDYFVKEEMQVVANPQEYIQSSDAYCRDEAGLNANQMDIQDKLFICSLRFEGSKEMEKEQEGNLHEATLAQEGSNEITEGMGAQKGDEGQEVCQNSSEDEKKQEDEFFDENILNMKEDEITQKRTSARKVKSVPNKSYSEDEVEENYYESSNDGQDPLGSKFKCDVCSKRYNTQRGLKKHSLVHERKHKCNVCSKMFYKLENMENHKKVHASKPLACQLCHTCFSKPQSLVKHLKSHTEKVNDMIKQISTDEQKDNSGKEAKKEMKLEEEDSDDEGGAVNEVYDFENAPELYKCEVCSQYCSSLKSLKRHTLVHGDKKYSCTVCKKWFFRPDTLKKHAERHGHGLLDNLVDDNKFFDSDDDAYPGGGQNNLPDESVKKEESDEDGGSGEYKCQHCDKIMATKKGLRRHVSMHKPKAEPVTCEICGKVCASQARLVLHQRTHKPKEKVPREYLCHICSKVYPSNSSLTYHMRTHTGIKPHVCKTCNSGFTTTTSLANHIRIHTGDKPFVCHVCSAAFAVSSAFRRHLTRHTGEANYLCKTCGKAFKRLSTLKEHTYTHSGEKPYVCKTCGAAYSHSGSLFAHQKRCRAQYGEMVVDEHHHAVTHHIHVNNVQSAVRSLAVIGQMF